jgi:hypothetical protein
MAMSGIAGICRAVAYSVECLSGELLEFVIVEVPTEPVLPVLGVFLPAQIVRVWIDRDPAELHDGLVQDAYQHGAVRVALSSHQHQEALDRVGHPGDHRRAE